MLTSFVIATLANDVTLDIINDVKNPLFEIPKKKDNQDITFHCIFEPEKETKNNSKNEIYVFMISAIKGNCTFKRGKQTYF